MKKNGLLILVTALGYWTQYFFLFYCLLLALTTVILLFRGGRKKEVFRYVRSMVIAAVIGVGVYPFGVKHILTSGRGVEAIGNLASGLSGYGERLLAFGRLLLARTLGQGPLGSVIVTALLGLGVVLLVIGRSKARDSRDPEQAENGKNGWRGLGWMLVFPPVGYFLLAARMSPYMVDRYIMPVFPFAAMALTGLLIYLWRRPGLAGEGSVLWALLAVSCASVFTYDGEYLYKGYGIQLRMAEEYASLPCICVYEGYGFYDNLLEFQTYDRTLLVKPSELEDRQDIGELPEVVVLLKQNVEDTEEVWEMLAGYGLRQQGWIIRGNGVYGDILALFVNDAIDGESPQ